MRDNVIRLLDLLGFDRMLATEIESFIVQYDSQLKAHLNDTHGPEREKAIEILRAAIESNKSALKDAVVDVYEATLDEETVEVVLTFFASKACARHNEVSPAVIRVIQDFFNKQIALVAGDLDKIFKDAINDATTGAVPVPPPPPSA